MRFRPVLRKISLGKAFDARVRAVLIDGLYAQPSAILTGSICGLLFAWGAAIEARHPVIYATAIALTVTAITRVVLSLTLPKIKTINLNIRERLYEIGAFGYAACCGAIAAETLLFLSPSPVQTLAVCNAIGYGVAIAARNAGRPNIAIGQMLLSTGPIIVACAISSNTALVILAITIALLLPAMGSITFNFYDALRSSIIAAEKSAKLAERMQVLARTDVVTGLLNRAGMNHHLNESFEKLAEGQKMALFWLDLDKFKEVNDSLGHQTGDKLLAEVAERLKAIAAGNASVARFGGDEFIFSFLADDHGTVEAMANKILNDVTQPMRIDGNRLEVGTSIGIAILPEDGAEVETVMRSADLALYHAKVSGGRQISFFEPSMTRDLMRRREIEIELRQAVQRDELTVFYQPIVDLSTGRIRAFEALVRWFHPEKGELTPDEFIPVAEESGAIITLGNWITVQAAKTAASWPEDITIAVNLSPVQIRAPGAALGILNALREAKLDPSRLELEITETVLLEHIEQTESFIEELGAAGVRFALDDFGTGYSSLSYLNKYPFSKIKVDRSFVSGSNVGVKSDAIIRAVSSMGASLNISIVAEGLEAIEQVTAVRAAGCTLGQGYYFSRAVPAYQANALLATERLTPGGLRKAVGFA